MFKTILLAGVTCLGLHAGTVIYTDFGAGQTYNTTTGWGVLNASGLMGTASPFDLTASGTLGQIDVALAYFSDTAPTLPLSIAVETDASGLPSGTILDSWSLPAADVTGTAQIFSFTSTANPVLTVGTPYWLVLSTLDTNGYVWLENSQGVVGKAYNSDGVWNVNEPLLTTGAFDAISTSSVSGVPEPGYAGLTSILLLGVLRFRKRS